MKRHDKKLPTNKMTILIAVGVAITLMVGTWFAASQFQSSAQRVAAAEPPAVQPVLVPVQKTDLVDRTTMKATAKRSGERKYVLPKAGATSVITREGVKKGQELRSGQIITWVNDRPVFALKGGFPLYRDLGPGDTGEDVRMLQKALADLGYDIAADGIFGSWTATCIKNFYTDNGAVPAQREKKQEPSANNEPTPERPQSDAQMPTPRPASKPQQENYLPASEVIMIPELPGHISSTPTLGTTLGDDNSALEMASSTVVMSSEIPGPVAARFSEGRPGKAILGETAIDITVSTISEKKDEASGDETSPAFGRESSGNSIVQFSAVNSKIPAEWAERNDILIEIDLSEPMLGVLTVPQRAIAIDATGKASVLIHNGATFTQTPVRELGCITGMCAIEAAGTESLLKEGVHVRVDR